MLTINRNTDETGATTRRAAPRRMLESALTERRVVRTDCESLSSAHAARLSGGNLYTGGRECISRRRRVVAPSVLFLLALSIALAGCSHPDTRPGAGRGDTWPAPMNDPQISVLTPELREWLGFQPAVITREADGRMTDIQIPVRNLTERQYLIEYRFIYFDRDGRQLEPVMGWKFENLDPKQVARLRGVASLVDAHDYRLEVRWSR